MKIFYYPYMKKNSLLSTFAVWMIIIMAAVLSFNSCGNRDGGKSAAAFKGDYSAVSSTSSENTDISEEIKNFRLHQTRGGKVVWTLIASKAKFISSDEVSLEKPLLKLYYNPQYEPSATGNDRAFSSSAQMTVITAARGKAELKTSFIETYGSTLLESPDKKIYASDVRYDPSADRISTDKKVLIITDDSEISGSSMVSDSRLEKITISDQQVRMKPR